MEQITKLWAFLNGKKTTIGAFLMTLSIILTEVMVGIWGMEADWIPMAVKTLNWTGMFLGGTGLIHKSIK